MRFLLSAALFSILVLSSCKKDPEATCFDGKQNGSETGIDCGGSCADCDTSSCSDGIQNGTETDIDCGGSCEPCLTCPDMVTDIDGFDYDVLMLGGNCWTARNFRAVTFNDGEPIPEEDRRSYQNSISNDMSYGLQYTFATANSGKLCPEGWHLATVQDWEDLLASLGGGWQAGGPLKSTSSAWEEPNTGATNSTGFGGMPAGSYSISFGEANGGYWGFHWSNGVTDLGQGMCLALSYSSAIAEFHSYWPEELLSCRCVKD